MHVRDYWKLTRLLVVCVIIKGTSCDGNFTDKDLHVTTQKGLQNEEVELGAEVDIGLAGTLPRTRFPVRSDEGNWVPRPPASSGNESKTEEMKISNPPLFVSGNGAIRQRVTTLSAEVVPDDHSNSRISVTDSSLYTRRFNGTEASTFKSTEHEIPFLNQGGLDTSTLWTPADETSFTEFDDSEATTLRETSDETYPTVVNTLSPHTEITTSQSTDQQQSSRILHTTDAYSYDTYGESTDAYLYTNEESTDRSPLPSESSHTTVQGPLFTTKKLVDLVTTTMAVSLSTTPTRDQITKQNKSTTHTNGSYSSGPTQTQEINADKPVWTLGQSIPIIACIAVIILAVLGIATIFVIKRKTRSTVILSSDNEKFFIPRNHEDELLSNSFLDSTKSTTVEMYSDIELETIEPSEMQDMVLDNVVHDEETKTPKCLATTTMIRDIGD
ncbi:mucin-22-like [Palaemon carinicauda]|uniref:mucin-22-like n=1 Tax=Palaemon carinicauda TaxID=392227 RepID=UPI0035B58B86